MSNNITALVVVLVFIITGVFGDSLDTGLSYNATCLNPSRASGRCIFVRECTSVLSILRKETLTNDDVAFLYESECGKAGDKSLVCCPFGSIDNHYGAAFPESAAQSTFGSANRVDAGSNESDSGEKLSQRKLLPAPGECGIQPRYELFGENVTKLDEHPWTALIHFGIQPYETSFECGGILISSRYVLTAGHCVADSTKWSNLTVRLGEWDTESTVDCIGIEDFNEFYCADPAIDVPVQNVFIHENYTRQHRPQLNDIALLRLVEPINTTTWIQPVCLPQQPVPDKDAQDDYTLAGWGNNGCGFNSRYKIRSRLVGLNQDHCKHHLPKGFRRTNDYFCTVPVNEGEKCHADSGGAVTGTKRVPKIGVVHEVEGLLNYMKECQSSRPVGIFTNVRQYLDWIVSKIEE
ncbi:serine protease easter-like [Malaya genurostris]|uniref:serine protease easter-like n=1 Tax=Malaya genurostris TaxID=325434 RepID=UPI0026F3BD32|nr:serine protease easter-like [Malaya genurostris]